MNIFALMMFKDWMVFLAIFILCVLLFGSLFRWIAVEIAWKKYNKDNEIKKL